jgi:hypothetical protein
MDMYCKCYLGGLEYTANEWKIPHSKIGVNSEGAHRLNFTAIYVAVTVGGYSHPKPVIHGRRRGYQLHRRQTQYRMKGG